jgi:hypothetical protein
MSSTESRVGWSEIKECLGALHRVSPEFLSKALLIGGAACWFYKVQLQNARDPDFSETEESTAVQNSWLSKDIDFTGIFRGDALEMLPSLVARDDAGNRYLQVNGVRLGFAQVGVTFDPAEAYGQARIGEFQAAKEIVRFLVIDPVTLYREKAALAARRNQPHDHLHLATLKSFVGWEVVATCDRYLNEIADCDLGEQQAALAFLLDVKRRALELLQDPNVRQRTTPLLETGSLRAKYLRDTLFVD